MAESVAALTKKNITVTVESGAGEKAFCSDTEYEKAAAQIKTRQEVLDSSDIILAIHPLAPSQIINHKSQILIGVYQP